MPQHNVFCNICTANYLLAGIYNYIIEYVYTGTDLTERNGKRAKHHWWHLMENFGISEEVEALVTLYHDSTAPAANQTQVDENKPVILLKIKGSSEPACSAGSQPSRLPKPVKRASLS